MDAATSLRHQAEGNMDIKPVETEEDYQATLREIESLMRAALGSPEGERLDALVTLIETYERQHYPLDLPDLTVPPHPANPR
jgi:antitoxin component HigA of HigAB toxin-antitoxin module